MRYVAVSEAHVRRALSYIWKWGPVTFGPDGAFSIRVRDVLLTQGYILAVDEERYRLTDKGVCVHLNPRNKQRG